MDTYRLAVIEGDGIGREVVPEGLAAVRAAAQVTGSFAITTVDHPWSCEYYATHGRMMDDDALPRLFEPGFRGDPARSPGGGAGLGLAIARTVARTQGGDIVLANRPEGGLKATISLPK